MPTMLPIIIQGLSDVTSNAYDTATNDLLVGIGAVLVILLLVTGAGGVFALLASAISRFLNHNVPSTEAMAAFNLTYAEQLRKKQNEMEKVNTPTDPLDEEEDYLVEGGSPFERVAKGSRYIALLAAWIATCGSLFFSEVLGWVPCLLCWYQRILMYPLALILAVGILRKDKGLYKYALVLSIPGACVSAFHYLYQKTTLFSGMVPCTVGVPCSSDYLNWFGGVVTIPFLALIAFLIITFCMVASRLGASDEEELVTAIDVEKAPQRSRIVEALPVLGIIVLVVAAFLVAGILVKSGVAVASPPAETTTTQQAPLPTPNSAAIARGKVLYEETCAACHGVRGEGTSAGKALLSSTLVKTSSDAELVKFVQLGRTANDPHNTTGLAMPANGGQANVSSSDIAAVIAYIRQLAGSPTSGQ
ncbi:MAG TPA: disulfide oxidoreductase [Anaerolineae bacterium]